MTHAIIWWGARGYAPTPKSTDLHDLMVSHSTFRLVAAYAKAYDERSGAVRLHWYDASGPRHITTYTAFPTGAWVLSDGREDMLPLTQGELCADDCKMLSEFLGYHPDTLLPYLTPNS